MNVLPQKIINHYTPNLHNKTQGSTGGKVTDLENLVFVTLVTNVSKQIYSYKGLIFFFT